MKLATTTGDLVYYCSSPAEAVRAFEGTGFTHLDYTFWRLGWYDRPILKDDWFEPVKEAAKEAERLGFDFVQAHAPGLNFVNDEDDYENIVLADTRSIEACGYLGIDKIVVHNGSGSKYLYPADKEAYFEANRKFYERLYPAMEKYGVKVLIENLPHRTEGGSYFLGRGEEMKEFLDYCGHPLLGACWDTGHGNMDVESPYDDLMALGDKLEALHVQDNFGERDNHLAPFMGNMDIDSLMNALLGGSFAKRGCYFTFECDSIIAQGGRRCDPRFKKVANDPTLSLKRAAVRFMYEIGKSILTAYDCFEE